ncbi:hypothetical protein E4U33_002861 [Claviceps sp. LM78 group G4]|nr:hypothetical protein E4U33_002861 [Claviceps sp. LM78 group G4]
MAFRRTPHPAAAATPPSSLSESLETLLPLPLRLYFGTTHPRSKENFQSLVEAFQPSLLFNFFCNYTNPSQKTITMPSGQRPANFPPPSGPPPTGPLPPLPKRG